MRVLLDECLPRRLSALIAGHDVVTVPKAGLAGLANGTLLRRISGNFDAFITVDRNLPAQNLFQICRSELSFCGPRLTDWNRSARLQLRSSPRSPR